MKTLPFDIKKTGQIVVFIGIQASGKTTFFKEPYAELINTIIKANDHASKQECVDTL